jgi:hypothetical protein
VTTLEHKTTRDLISEIERKDRRFKFASVVFGAICTAGMAVLLIVGVYTLAGVNQQLGSQKVLLESQNKILSTISASSKQRTRQINDLQDHINCIVSLFQQPNRSQLTITDLENCQLTNPNAASRTAAPSAPVAPQTGNSSNTNSQLPSTNTSPPATNEPTPQPTENETLLNSLPVVGGIFKAIGL